MHFHRPKTSPELCLLVGATLLASNARNPGCAELCGAVALEPELSHPQLAASRCQHPIDLLSGPICFQNIYIYTYFYCYYIYIHQNGPQRCRLWELMDKVDATKTKLWHTRKFFLDPKVHWVSFACGHVVGQGFSLHGLGCRLDGTPLDKSMRGSNQVSSSPRPPCCQPQKTSHPVAAVPVSPCARRP